MDQLQNIVTTVVCGWVAVTVIKSFFDFINKL